MIDLKYTFNFITLLKYGRTESCCNKSAVPRHGWRFDKGSDNAKPERYRYDYRWSNPADRFDLYYVDPELAARISKLVSDFNLFIVSSATWRIGKAVDDFKTRLTNRFLPGDRMIGFTPDGESEGMIRADKIRYWILNSGYDIIRYIVLDDEVKANYNTKVGSFF